MNRAGKVAVALAMVAAGIGLAMYGSKPAVEFYAIRRADLPSYYTCERPTAFAAGEEMALIAYGRGIAGKKVAIEITEEVNAAPEVASEPQAIGPDEFRWWGFRTLKRCTYTARLLADGQTVAEITVASK